ncbi:uncharacterized protein LOC133931311 [Phragmites australis]|uniref:uncharacterized protein LOC133931311 n=1 Tax=Phragmites australis TaxID=29695 RepID=UPI002D77EC25|nr:uncharacterized protein LOC133931311 [Phragmites australis]
MADLIPTIVLAMGAAALGGPDALRFLLAFAGRSPAVDVAVCVFAISAATTSVLGIMLLVRIFRRASVVRNAAAPHAPATDVFPKMVRMVAFPVAFLVTACLLAAQALAPGSELDAGQYACSA